MKFSKKFRKSICILLSILMIAGVLSAAPFTAFAATSGTEGGVDWNYNSTTKTLTFSASSNPKVKDSKTGEKYASGEMKDFSNGTGDSGWSGYRDKATSVIINRGVTSIGNNGLAFFSKLTAIELPDTLTRLGARAFNQSPIKSFTLPGSITDIDINCFENSSLESVVLSEGITFVGRGMFLNCKELKNVSLPSTLTNMRYYAFNGCTSLEEIVIPEGVTSIGEKYETKYSAGTSGNSNTGYAFSGCTSLTKVVLPGTLTKINQGSFNGCASLTDIELPENLETIESSAFYGCKSLNSPLKIPYSVTSVGNNAFVNCPLGYDSEAGTKGEVWIYNPKTTITGTNTFGYTSTDSKTFKYFPFVVYGREKSGAHNYIDPTNGTEQYKSNTANNIKFQRIDVFVYTYEEMIKYAKSGRTGVDYTLANDISFTQADVDAYGPITVLDNVVLNLNLNGYSITGDTTGAMFKVNKGEKYTGQLVITDNYVGEATSDDQPPEDYMFSTRKSDEVSEGVISNKQGRAREYIFDTDGDLYAKGGIYTYDVSVDVPPKTHVGVRLKAEDGVVNYRADKIDGGTQEVEDKNDFGLKKTQYNYFELLGVQLKDDIETENTVGNALRFVAVINEGMMKGDNIRDYGFIVTRTKKYANTKEFQGQDQDKNQFAKMAFSFNHTRGTTVSCRESSNTISGDYGEYDNTDTTYKYVTLVVNNIPDVGTENESSIAVRFYMQTKSGDTFVTYFSDYIIIDGETETRYDGCCAKFSTVESMLSTEGE